MKTILQAALGQRKMVSDVQFSISKARRTKRGHDVPHTKKPNLRAALHHLAVSRPSNTLFLNVVAEVQSRRRTSAEPYDVDHTIALVPRLAQMIVCL